MAVILASVLGNAQAASIPHVTAQLSQHEVPGELLELFGDFRLLSSNTKVDQASINPTPKARNSSQQATFYDSLYGRVHVRPQQIDAGNVASNQTYAVEVWNASLYARTLTAINQFNVAGLTLSGDQAPTVYELLGSRIYTLEISVDGPPDIDALYEFVFGSATGTLQVLGRLLAAWCWDANWIQPVIERWRYLTNVLSSSDGSRQTRALRQWPRRELEFLALAKGVERQRLDTRLAAWQGRKWLVPIVTDAGYTSAAANAGSAALYIDTDGLDYAEGSFVLIVRDANRYETIEIESVYSDRVELVRSLQYDWPARSRVYPARIGRLAASQPLRAVRNDVQDLYVQWRLDPHPVNVAIDSATTYRGYPVLNETPNKRIDVTSEWQRQLATLDNQTGLVGSVDTIGLPTRLQDHLWTRAGRAQINAYRAWLAARLGRAKGIWVSTGADDLTLTADVLPDANDIDVTNIGYTTYLLNQRNRRDIEILLRGGSRIYARVTVATAQSEDIERLTLSHTFGSGLARADVLRISWLEWSALAGDSVEMRWFNGRLIEATNRFESVLNDV